MANPACGACFPGEPKNGPWFPWSGVWLPPCPGPLVPGVHLPTPCLALTSPCRPLSPEVLAQCTPHSARPEPLCMHPLPLHSGPGLTPEGVGGCLEAQALCAVDKGGGGAAGRGWNLLSQARWPTFQPFTQVTQSRRSQAAAKSSSNEPRACESRTGTETQPGGNTSP